jgi:hypothetical protein
MGNGTSRSGRRGSRTVRGLRLSPRWNAAPPFFRFARTRGHASGHPFPRGRCNRINETGPSPTRDHGLTSPNQAVMKSSPLSDPDHGNHARDRQEAVKLRTRFSSHQRRGVGKGQRQDSAAKLRRRTLVERTRILSPGQGSEPVEMHLVQIETERKSPAEAGLGNIFFLFGLESLEEIVPGRGSREGGLRWGVNHGVEQPGSERLALIGPGGQDTECGRPGNAYKKSD